MRFSEILRDFYGIQFKNEEDADCIDVYFTGASFHYLRLHSSRPGSELWHHYFKKHRQHFKHLLALISERAGFEKAQDPSHRNLQLRESWNPEFPCVVLDEEIFSGMKDIFKLIPMDQIHHPNDIYLFCEGMTSKAAA